MNFTIGKITKLESHSSIKSIEIYYELSFSRKEHLKSVLLVHFLQLKPLFTAFAEFGQCMIRGTQNSVCWSVVSFRDQLHISWLWAWQRCWSLKFTKVEPHVKPRFGLEKEGNVAAIKSNFRTKQFWKVHGMNLFLKMIT